MAGLIMGVNFGEVQVSSNQINNCRKVLKRLEPSGLAFYALNQ